MGHFSGLVHGRSNDALETLGDGEYCKAKNVSSNIRAATATRSPDGRFLSMCFFSFEFDYDDVNKVGPPVPMQLDMDLVGDESERSNKGVAMSRLPDLPAKVGLMPTCPIFAAGELWAPYLTGFHGPSKFVMQRLDKDAGRWVEVAAVDVPLPPQSRSFREDSIPVIQGFAVVGHTILLSLYPYHLFFTFDCLTGSWAPVVITNNNEKQHNYYMPIRKRGVYVEEDDTVYCLCGGCVVYAYKLICIDKNGQYRMAPPTAVDRVYPTHNEGSGFLAHLGGRVMCFVWIGLRLRCSCDDTKHVLVTTFRIKGDDDSGYFVPKGVEVLHSTCRRLHGILPRKTYGCYYEFSFLQEYAECNLDEKATTHAENGTGNAVIPSTLLEPMEVQASSNVVESSNKELACCRNFLNGMPFSYHVMLEASTIQTNKDLHIVCQVASQSAVFKINVVNGKLTCHDMILMPQCILETFMCDHEDDDDLMDRPPPWHFVCGSDSIYAVPYIENKIYRCCLQTGTPSLVPTRRPTGDEFPIVHVLRVGNKIIAISDTLHGVYRLCNNKNEWMWCSTSGLPELDRKIKLSGYVVLGDESFMVSDADTNCCFLLDLQLDRWSIVMPLVEFIRSVQDRKSLLPRAWPADVRGFLSGRSMFAEGFIYTCSSGGLTACEVIAEGGSYYLGNQINLQFPLRKNWDRNRMCFDYIGRDSSSGAIMFCVVQGEDCYRSGYPEYHRPVCVTTVKVQTEGMPNGKLKPKTIGHVDISMFSVESNARVMWTRSCFSVYP